MNKPRLRSLKTRVDRLEKQRNKATCPYCHPTKAGKYRGADIGEPQGFGRPYQLHLDGRMLAVTNLDGGTQGFAVRYCPMCGRRLE